jgi:hypothetical protein
MSILLTDQCEVFQNRIMNKDFGLTDPDLGYCDSLLLWELEWKSVKEINLVPPKCTRNKNAVVSGAWI